MIGLGFHNSIDTTLDLNGPFLRYTTQPSISGDVSNGGSVTLSGIATAEFKHNPTIPGERVTNTGNVEYQWYINDVIAVDGTYGDQEISGSQTSELTVTNLTNPADSGKTAVLYASYGASAYQSSTPVTAGTARSTGNAPNAPLLSDTITINVIPALVIDLQPIEVLDGIEDTFSIFNIRASTTDPDLDSQIAYQWRIGGVNLVDSATVIGSNTSQLQIKQLEGTYTIDCMVTHPTAEPSPLQSSQVTYISESIKEFVNLETYDGRNESVPFSMIQQNLNEGPLNITGRAQVSTSENPNPVGAGLRAGSVVYFLHAPEADVDVLIEMAAAAGASFGGIQSGQGGWGCFRMTLKQNVEYAIKLGTNEGEIMPVGGAVLRDPIRGAYGGGIATIYEKNQLLAALGAGGGAGLSAAGGDGGGFNLAGQSGFGRRGGNGGNTRTPNTSFQDRFLTDIEQRGGSLGSCPSPNTDVFRDQGLAQCADYTQSGHFKKTSVDANGVATLVEFPTSALLNRGFRPGQSGRVNGGYGLDGGGGGGGAGSEGGSGGEGNGVGGGGGSGYADTGRVTVLRTTSGVNGGDAYLRVSLFDPDAPIPNPPAPSPPNFVRSDWNDSRNLGYKIGTEGDVGGGDQTKPGESIKGPTGSLQSPPHNYISSFDKNRNARGSGENSPNGIFFIPNDVPQERAENISYVAFRLRLRRFGPRGGDSTTYLTSNRGNQDPNRGTVRKWYTNNEDQARRDDRYTTNKNEAFVPFRIVFRLGFACAGNGDYRILYSEYSHDYNSFNEKKDIDFDASSLASQNGLRTDGSGKLIFPDFGIKTYSHPRLFELKTDIYNLDTGEKNRINMFAEATRDDRTARESNFVEFGKFIIT